MSNSFDSSTPHLIAHSFIPENLTIARKMRGLTKRELAQNIDKTPGAISQFENGKTKPDVITLKTIAFALGFPLEFFAKELTQALVEIDNCHFRSLRTTSQISRNKVLASGVLLNNLINFIEEYVELPKESVSQVSKIVDNNDDIEKLAIEVRKTWGYGIGPIPNLTQMLEAKGIIVSYLPEDSLDVDAFSTWQFSRPSIFLVPTKGSASRTRFSCAHELGHLLMHVDAKPGSKFLEDQANRFAGAFLFPRDAFIREFPNRLNWEHLYELKKRWKVAIAAMIKRAYDLDCISQRTYKRAFVHLNQTKQRKNEPYEPKPETPSLILDSLKLLQEDFSLQEIAKNLCIQEKELINLIKRLSLSSIETI